MNIDGDWLPLIVLLVWVLIAWIIESFDGQFKFITYPITALVFLIVMVIYIFKGIAWLIMNVNIT